MASPSKSIPTVRVVDARLGVCTINECDFDATRHQLISDDPTQPIIDPPDAPDLGNSDGDDDTPNDDSEESDAGNEDE